ncbi:MAG TPA: hypothetical protein DGG94_12545, partial [Micromonosporaceae bacterium]|nr:hypothetical protein [Micromonosporaceae bacterium]
MILDMRWLVTTSQRFWTLLVGVAVALALVGVAQLRDASVDVLPELASTVVNVQTEALGLSAAEVEQLVTVPLEQNLLNGVAWLQEIRSESMNGLSSIELLFEPGTDVLDARQMVAERLTHAHILPKVTKPPVMLQPVSSSNRLMVVELSSTTLSPIELSVLARWNIRPRLMGVPGVANVAIWGQRERQLQVQITPERLQQQGVTLNQVVRAAANALWVSPLTYVEASTPGSGGFIDAPNQRLGLRHVLPISSPEDLAKVVLQTADGKIVRLGDVAEVVEDHQPLIGDALVAGGRGLALVIEKFPNTSTTAVTEEVEAAMQAMRPGLTGVEVDTTAFRPASFIETALGNLGFAALLAVVLLFLVFGLTFRGWRSTIVSVITVVASMLTALLVLHWLGATFNVVVLTGLVIALGVIIDDAVVTVDAIARGQDRPTAAQAVTEAVLRIRGPLMFATAAIVCVAGPLLLVEGPARALFRTLGLSYLAAVLASTLVALTLGPALAVVMTTGRRPEAAGSDWLRHRYEALLAGLIHRPVKLYAVTGLALLIGFAALVWPSGWPTLPAIKDRNLVISWVAPPGTSRTEIVRVTGRLEQELITIPGVRNVTAHMGRAVTSDQVTDVETGKILISLDSKANYDATLTAIRAAAAGYPGMRTEVLSNLDELTSSLFMTSPAAIGVRIYGSNQTVLQEKAAEIRQAMTDTRGITNARTDEQVQTPTVKIEVDLAAAQRYGVKPGDVRRATSAMISGIEVGNLFEEQKVFDVLVVGAPVHRENLTTIQNLLVDTPSGQQVRLSDVARVEVVGSPSIIRHEAVNRYIDVLADVSPGVRSAKVDQDVRERVKKIDFPSEHHAEVFDEPTRDQENIATIIHIAASVIAIFLLLQAVLRSWSTALTIMLLLPGAVAGGVVAAVLGGGAYSFGMLAGVVRSEE